MSEELKEARIRAGLSVEDVSKTLNIRRQYIIALEDNKLSEIPSVVYVNGYRKVYSRLLGVEYIDNEQQTQQVSKIQNMSILSISKIPIVLISIILFIVALWIYITNSQSDSAVSVVTKVEDVSPQNYMTNIASPEGVKENNDDESQE